MCEVKIFVINDEKYTYAFFKFLTFSITSSYIFGSSHSRSIRVRLKLWLSSVIENCLRRVSKSFLHVWIDFE